MSITADRLMSSHDWHKTSLHLNLVAPRNARSTVVLLG